ncbi:MAG: hypothetical protein CL609_14200 [Anaerolineaceae bacterium]|nr:hypothetical protein [Anaerolineaceae bacterium]
MKPVLKQNIMIRRLFVILLLLSFVLPFQTTVVQASAGILSGPGWVVVASNEEIIDPIYGALVTPAIYTIYSEDQSVYGPFLVNELRQYDEGSGFPINSSVFDVSVTPDGQTVLLVERDLRLVHFIDLSDPTAPVYLDSVQLFSSINDLAITPDGRFALVSAESVSVVSIHQRKLVYQLVLPTFERDIDNDPVYGYASAIAVNNAGTIVVADAINHAVHTIRLWSNGAMTYYGSHKYFLNVDGDVALSDEENYQRFNPINVTIAPDESTVLVSDGLNYVDTTQTTYQNLYAVGVYQITSPGQVQFIDVLSGLPRVMQSFDFNRDGSKAYALGNNGASYDESASPQTTLLNDSLYMFDMNGTGDIVFDNSQSVDLLFNTTDQYQGTDCLAVYEGIAYMTYANDSLDSTSFPQRFVSIVDLSDLSLQQLNWGSTSQVTPTGVGVRVFIPFKTYFPLVNK